MNIKDLNKEQMRELKVHYLCDLANEGRFAETLNTDHDEPSYWDLAQADQLVSDDDIRRKYEGVEFSEDDFSCSANSNERNVEDEYREEKVVVVDLRKATVRIATVKFPAYDVDVIDARDIVEFKQRFAEEYAAKHFSDDQSPCLEVVCLGDNEKVDVYVDDGCEPNLTVK